MTQNKARRTNEIDFLQLPWAQEVPGSNPGAPTKKIWRVLFYLLKAPFTSNAICGILADIPLSRSARRGRNGHNLSLTPENVYPLNCRRAAIDH
jgi:hypothetical protein